MYDRPDLKDLIDAVHVHLEDNIKEAVRSDRKLYFQTLIAINLLKIAGRELNLTQTHQKAQWERLNALQGDELAFPTDPDIALNQLHIRNHQLCADIRAGHFDEINHKLSLFSHLVATTVAQLEVANPQHLDRINSED